MNGQGNTGNGYNYIIVDDDGTYGGHGNHEGDLIPAPNAQCLVGAPETTEAPSETTEVPSETTEAPTETTEAPPTTETHGHTPVPICHKVNGAGSTGNGYNYIIVDDDGTYGGHGDHEGDLIPAPNEQCLVPPVETTEPPVETTEPPVETTEPPVETTEPPVETTDPATETTDPATETTDPATETTDSATVTTAAVVVVLSQIGGVEVVTVQPQPAPDPAPAAAPAGAQTLPATGTDPALATAVGAALLLIGGAMLLAGRRKPTSSPG